MNLPTQADDEDAYSQESLRGEDGLKNISNASGDLSLPCASSAELTQVLLNHVPEEYSDGRRFVEALDLQGRHLKMFVSCYGLHPTDIPSLFGMSSASMYHHRRNREESIPFSTSILMRLYAVFPSLLPIKKTITRREFFKKIKAIDPKFKIGHFGILLGLKSQSGYRLMSESTQCLSSTSNIIDCVNRLIDEDPKNWFLIKKIVEQNAHSMGIEPPSAIWAENMTSTQQRKKKQAHSAKDSPDKIEAR